MDDSWYNNNFKHPETWKNGQQLRYMHLSSVLIIRQDVALLSLLGIANITYSFPGAGHVGLCCRVSLSPFGVATFNGKLMICQVGCL